MTTGNTITFYYRGGVERGTGNRKLPYRWHNGYSENSGAGLVTYPWMTRTECYRYASSIGKVSKFIMEQAPVVAL